MTTIQRFAIDIAHQAGALLMNGLKEQRQVQLKGPFDLVTNIDQASEQLIVQAIEQQFPDHAIMAEEGHHSDGTSEYMWVIDPIDGTTNYAHGFPHFCVSLALLADCVPIMGIIFDPWHNELFIAERGHGARCNDQQIHVSTVSTLTNALVSTGFPYDYASNPHNNLPEFDRVRQCVQGVRRAGSGALDLAYVAMGRLEAHWERGLQPWDSAAGSLLIHEAGGTLSDYRGNTWNPWSNCIVASNGLVHDELLSILVP